MWLAPGGAPPKPEDRPPVRRTEVTKSKRAARRRSKRTLSAGLIGSPIG